MSKKNTAQTTSAKKTLKKVITLQLVKQLTDITGQVSSESKDLTKAIEKGARKLAKKISKQIKPVKTEAPKAAEINPVKPTQIAAISKTAVKALPPATTVDIKSPAAKTPVKRRPTK